MAHFKKSLLQISACTVVLAGLGCFPQASQAGFEWKPGPTSAAAPAKESALPETPAMPAMPQGQVESTKLSTDQAPAPQRMAPAMPVAAPDAPAYPVLPPAMAAMAEEAPPAPPVAPPSAPAADMEAARIPSGPDETIASAPVRRDPAPAPVTASPSGETGYADAVGFGSDIPLALAMRQMVPSEYNFRFDSGVRQNTKISWNGGKPWNVALNDALQPAGYVATVEGKTVHVSNTESKIAAAAAPNEPRLRSVPMAMPEMPSDPVSKAPPEDKAPPRVQARADAGSVVSTPDKEEAIPRPPEAAPPMAAAPADEPPMEAAMPVEQNPSLPPTMATPAAKSQPVREVYIRRNSSKEEVAERTPGKISAAAPDAMPTESAASPHDQPKHGFWSRMNPANWSDGEEVQAAPEEARMAGGTRAAPPATPAKTTTEQSPAPLSPPLGELPPGVETEHLNSPSSAAAPMKTSSFNAMSVKSWQAAKGDSLKSVLQRWSDDANVQLYWVPTQDYPLTEEIKMEGSYTDAVSSVLASFGDKGQRPIGRLHPNMPDGPAVLIVEPSSS